MIFLARNVNTFLVAFRGFPWMISFVVVILPNHASLILPIPGFRPYGGVSTCTIPVAACGQYIFLTKLQPSKTVEYLFQAFHQVVANTRRLKATDCISLDCISRPRVVNLSVVSVSMREAKRGCITHQQSQMR